MRFILIVEGETEVQVLPRFLSRYLNARLTQRVGIDPVKLGEPSRHERECGKRIDQYCGSPKQGSDVVGFISLLDLYGPDNVGWYPSSCKTAQERCEWGKQHLEKVVDRPLYRAHFAVHETEAWLLSDPTIFRSDIGKALPSSIAKPETVDFDEPPAKLLQRLYMDKTGRRYKKAVNSPALFAELNPEIAYGKCPYLADLLDAMLAMARAAGV